MFPLKLVVVMPAYNEEACIERVVEKWTSLFRERGLRPDEAQLIVVNDGSRDQTGAILDRLKGGNPSLTVYHQANGGHGAALMAAYGAAVALRAEWVFHVDSDDQFVTSDFGALWAQRDRSEFILGHRKKRLDAAHRLIISNAVKVLNFTLFGVWIPDANIPYRLIRGEFLGTLLGVMQKKVFAPNIFLSILAAKAGKDLTNIPVHHEERKTGTVSILRFKLLKVCFASVLDLLAFRIALPRSLKKMEREFKLDRIGLTGVSSMGPLRNS